MMDQVMEQLKVDAAAEALARFKRNGWTRCWRSLRFDEKLLCLFRFCQVVWKCRTDIYPDKSIRSTTNGQLAMILYIT